MYLQSKEIRTAYFLKRIKICFISKNFELHRVTLPLPPQGLIRMSSETRNAKDGRWGLVLENTLPLALHRDLFINAVVAFPGARSTLKYSEIRKYDLCL